MQAQLLCALRAQHAQIHQRWKELLHVEPISTPLANPDALEHLIDWSLQEIFRALGTLAGRRRASPTAAIGSKPVCPCGRNPLLTYFAAGEQAVRQAMILVQSATVLHPFERDASMAEVNFVLAQLARREIEAFCGVCQHRLDPTPAHALTASPADVAYAAAPH
ncbi:MAG: hypothetical protein ABIZ04_00500 [Opitutus sp.]